MQFGQTATTNDGALAEYRASDLEAYYNSGADEYEGDDPIGWYGGYPPRTESGVRVTRKVAFSYAPYWRALALISEDVGRSPLHIYKRISTPDGEGKDRDTKHPAYYLLRHEPNDYMSAQTFKTCLTLHACDKGNGYAYILRNGRGDPVELLPLDPERTEPVRIKGVLWYEWQPEDETRPKRIPSRDVLHIKGPTWEGIKGIGWRDVGRDTIGQGVATRKHTSGYFKRGASPAVVINVPGKMTKRTLRQLRSDWERMHAGSDNAHRTAILQMGATAAPLGTSFRDAQNVELQNLVIRLVSALTGVPPHKLGDPTRQGYASLEQENQAYLDHALDPWLVKWETECFIKLLTDKQKFNDTHVVSFNRKIFVQANLEARTRAYTAAKAGRWLTSNEIRAKEDENPLPGGNSLDVTPNMQPDGGTEPPEETPPPEDTQPENDT
jgi:HK97 family phage portal protein